MISRITRFNINEIVRKINEIIAYINSFGRASGDGLIEVKGRDRPTINLNLDRLRARIPHTSSGSGGGMHIAYAKTDASTGSTLDCYLDTDGTGTEITVNFLLSRATNLNEAGPRLQDGDAIIVTNIGGDWYAVQTFFGSEECS